MGLETGSIGYCSLCGKVWRWMLSCLKDVSTTSGLSSGCVQSLLNLRPPVPIWVVPLLMFLQHLQQFMLLGIECTRFSNGAQSPALDVTLGHVTHDSWTRERSGT